MIQLTLEERHNNAQQQLDYLLLFPDDIRDRTSMFYILILDQ